MESGTSNDSLRHSAANALLSQHGGTQLSNGVAFRPPALVGSHPSSLRPAPTASTPCKTGDRLASPTLAPGRQPAGLSAQSDSSTGPLAGTDVSPLPARLIGTGR